MIGRAESGKGKATEEQPIGTSRPSDELGRGYPAKYAPNSESLRSALADDIDWKQRYGEYEQPEVAAFLGYD